MWKLREDPSVTVGLTICGNLPKWKIKRNKPVVNAVDMSQERCPNSECSDGKSRQRTHSYQQSSLPYVGPQNPFAFWSFCDLMEGIFTEMAW